MGCEPADTGFESFCVAGAGASSIRCSFTAPKRPASSGADTQEPHTRQEIAIPDLNSKYSPVSLYRGTVNTWSKPDQLRSCSVSGVLTQAQVKPILCRIWVSVFMLGTEHPLKSHKDSSCKLCFWHIPQDKPRWGFVCRKPCLPASDREGHSKYPSIVLVLAEGGQREEGLSLPLPGGQPEPPWRLPPVNLAVSTESLEVQQPHHPATTPLPAKLSPTVSQ